jgi:hypothetical protein
MRSEYEHLRLLLRDLFHKKVVTDKRTSTEMAAHFGSYNFIPKKTKGTVQIVPAYRNKWPHWTDYWFYHHVCPDEDVALALENGLPKVHALVSEMTPMEGFRLAEVLGDAPRDREADDAFALTSRWQISQDLVEEWVALESPPLSSETRFRILNYEMDMFSLSCSCTVGGLHHRLQLCKFG